MAWQPCLVCSSHHPVLMIMQCCAGHDILDTLYYSDEDGSLDSAAPLNLPSPPARRPRSPVPLLRMSSVGKMDTDTLDHFTAKTSLAGQRSDSNAAEKGERQGEVYAEGVQNAGDSDNTEDM